LGLLYAKLDAITAKAILMGKDPIAKAVPEMVEMLPEAMKATMAGKVAILAGSTAAKAAGAFAIEGGTEAVQTAMEKVAGEFKVGKREKRRTRSQGPALMLALVIENPL
jgi:hypothetical protein